MLLAAICGAVVGCIAGLIPGLHTNLLAVIVGGLGFPVLDSVIFLSSLAVSRSVIDAVPTTFIGFSDDVAALSPSAKLVKKGEGVLSARLLVVGALLGGAACAFIVPILIFVLPILLSLVKDAVFWLLLAVVLFLLRLKWWFSFPVFLFAGILGVVALDSVSEPLFPLLSGLFGSSSLLFSFFSKTKVPSQKKNVRLPPVSVPSAFGVLAACVVTLFPGLSPSQAASLMTFRCPKKYLLVIGALGTSDVVVSLVTFFALGKTRNGAVVMMDRLVDVVTFDLFIALLASSLLALGFACFVAWWLAGKFVLVVKWFDARVISGVILSGLVVLCFVLSGWQGFVVFVCGTSLGIVVQKAGVAKSHMMGCLLVPTLMNLWPF